MKCPFITMSAVTGKPTKKDIYEYLSSLREHGIEQALIYPRSGCEIEYLSEEWFCTVGYFIESARALNMHIWLYDDFNWPSGDAGGRVTAVPEYRLQALVTKGERAGQITAKSRHNSGLFGEKFFPNLLFGEAVDYFIKCTHEEYYKRFGADFGTVIKGIFTDEPSIGYCCESDSVPYYDGIKDDYLSYCGRDFDKDMQDCADDFYSNVTAVVSKRFISCYVDKISSWCKEHSILMTGHLMCDHNPFYAVRHGGNALKTLSSFSLPGIDEIYTSFDDVCEASLLATAEYASGENGAMAELFALGPCDMSYDKKRAMLYLCACHKIDHYFLAISHLDLRGNLLVKDYFNTFSADQPDFIAMTELASEAKKASSLAKKDFVPDVYVRYPFDVASRNLSRDFDTVPFLNLINELVRNQIQWKYTTEDKADAPVIKFNDDFKFTVDKKPFDISSLKHSLTVTDKDGNAPLGIFVRRFSDGTFAVLNLYAPSGEYFIDGKSVILNEYGVYLSDEPCSDRDTVELSPKFEVTYKNGNVTRATFINSQDLFEIYCENDTDVTFAVRNGTKAFLNGKKIICENEAALLPRGMRGLYKCSQSMRLKKGLNTLKSGDDFKYLPSVLIYGDFEFDAFSGEICKLVLRPRKTDYLCNEKIYGYGEVEFTASVFVPDGASQIELYGVELCTQIYTNGSLLGTRAFSPYVFEIPRELCGKCVELKITQLSSISPLFGDTDFWDKTVKECGWRGTPSTASMPFGFSKAVFKI